MKVFSSSDLSLKKAVYPLLVVRCHVKGSMTIAIIYKHFRIQKTFFQFLICLISQYGIIPGTQDQYRTGNVFYLFSEEAMITKRDSSSDVTLCPA